ncbi:hypothetical protein KCU86_g3, partial [Aureobasidium melanogenum]
LGRYRDSMDSSASSLRLSKQCSVGDVAARGLTLPYAVRHSGLHHGRTFISNGSNSLAGVTQSSCVSYSAVQPSGSSVGVEGISN